MEFDETNGFMEGSWLLCVYFPKTIGKTLSENNQASGYSNNVQTLV